MGGGTGEDDQLALPVGFGGPGCGFVGFGGFGGFGLVGLDGVGRPGEVVDGAGWDALVVGVDRCVLVGADVVGSGRCVAERDGWVDDGAGSAALCAAMADVRARDDAAEDGPGAPRVTDTPATPAPLLALRRTVFVVRAGEVSGGPRNTAPCRPARAELLGPSDQNLASFVVGVCGAETGSPSLSVTARTTAPPARTTTTPMSTFVRRRRASTTGS